jgi:multiple sugar transport system substrate-binding protein
VPRFNLSVFFADFNVVRPTPERAGSTFPHAARPLAGGPPASNILPEPGHCHGSSRRLLTALALGLTAVLSTACGAARAADCVRVVSWADFRELALEQEVADSFAIRHPEIPLCIESLNGAGIYREKVLTSIAAGTPPGVFLLDGIDIPAFDSQNVLLDLAPFAARAGVDTSAFHPRMRELFSPGGRVIAFPKGFTPMVVYYNRDVFDSAGIAWPTGDWTWAEFRDTAHRLTRDTDGDGQVDTWGFGWPREFFYLQTWLWAGGGDLLSPDADHATGVLDSPATVSAIDFYLGLATRDSVVPRIEMFRRESSVPILRLFSSNRLGMFVSGHWSMPQLLEHERAGRIRFGVAPLPTRDGSPVTPVLYASGWAVPRNAAHRRWAVQVAAFLASDLAQRIRARGGLEIPASPAVASNVAARDSTGREAAFLATAANGRQPWGARVAKWREIEDALLDLLDRPLVRGEDVAHVAAGIAARIDRILGGDR